MAEDVSTGGQSARGIDDLLEEWRAEWLKSLELQIYELHHRRQIHDEFMAMLDAQDHPDTSIFQDAFHRMYIESQVLAIRRQADSDSRTLSLRRLIGQLEQHRKDFTRSWYVGRWMRDRDPNSKDPRERHLARFHLEQANAAFDKFTDEPGAEHLGGRRLQDDRDELEAMTDKVVRYANAVVAHVERNPEDVEVTYDDFNNAIDHLGEMLRRYFLLIDQGGLLSATPTIQGDWKGPFRRPLA
jgi:hypothetical protein